MRTPTNDPTDDHPGKDLATSGYGVTRPAAGYDEAYHTGSYPTVRQQGGHGQESGAEISGQGYGATATDATRSLQPTARQQRWNPAAELDLDTSMRGTAPPPLRSPDRRPSAAPERIGWTALGAQALPPGSPPTSKAKGPRLRVDWPNCKAHGLCHELLPEAIRLDEWGFPIVGSQPLASTTLDDARRAVIACPTLALRLVE